MRSLSSKHSLRLLKAAASLCIFCAFLSHRAMADPLTYLISVNPSGLSGTSGYLDLQFNPGTLPGSQLAFANVPSNGNWILGDGSNGISTGVVSGELDFAGVSFENTSPFNDYLQSLVFGSSPDSLFVTFDGPAIESPDGTSTSGSTFAISFFDSNLNPVLTNNPDGFAALININPGGTITTETFPNTDGGPSAVTLVPPSPPPSTTPEPATMLLVATGLSGIFALTHRKARSSRR